MPTAAEFQELLDNCTCKWKMINNRYGFEVTSNVEGFTHRSIFLPWAGYWNDSVFYEAKGEYWSSTLSDYFPEMAQILKFPEGEGIISDTFRTFGLPIRPVCELLF